MFGGKRRTVEGLQAQADYQRYLTKAAYLTLTANVVNTTIAQAAYATAKGGIAAVSQLQLLQPFFGLALAATLLRESVTPLMFLVTIGVIVCVACARKFAK